MEEDVEVEKYYIGVYDPKTGEMEVHPAPRVHIRREIKSLREKDAELAKRNTLADGVGALLIRLGEKMLTQWVVFLCSRAPRGGIRYQEV